MKENPFAPLAPAGNPVAVAQSKRKTGRYFEIFHNIFRGLFAFLCIGTVPVFVVRHLKMMFEEFGMDLPLATQLVLQFSSMVTRIWFLFLPACFCVFAGIEFGLLMLPNGKSKTLFNVAYWLALIVIVGTAAYSLWIAYAQLISALSQTNP